MALFGLNASTAAPEAQAVPHLDNRYRRGKGPRRRLCLPPTAGLQLTRAQGCMAGCSKVGGAALLGKGRKDWPGFLQGPGHSRGGCGCGCLAGRLLQAWQPAGWGVGRGDPGVAGECQGVAGGVLRCTWRQSLCTGFRP